MKEYSYYLADLEIMNIGLETSKRWSREVVCHDAGLTDLDCTN